ncbi:hypothetical protein C0991_006563 [Blastosporella zonata]|nr:hypothetical protein C0991_006563 [Blastosporella zonata]
MKALTRLKTTAANLAASAAFASAHDTARAELTIAMQKITDKLSTLVDAMENSAPQASPQQLNLPTTAPPQPQPTWAAVDRTPTGLAKLCTKVNAALATINAGSGSMNKTLVRGIQAAEKPNGDTGTLIVELDTPESAQRLLGYTADDLVDFPGGLLGTSATVSKHPHHLIVRFVPCDGIFDPDNDNHLRQVEDDNFLPADSIVAASWLKKPIHCSASQTLQGILQIRRDS